MTTSVHDADVVVTPLPSQGFWAEVSADVRVIGVLLFALVDCWFWRTREYSVATAIIVVGMGVGLGPVAHALARITERGSTQVSASELRGLVPCGAGHMVVSADGSVGLVRAVGFALPPALLRELWGTARILVWSGRPRAAWLAAAAIVLAVVYDHGDGSDWRRSMVASMLALTACFAGTTAPRNLWIDERGVGMVPWSSVRFVRRRLGRIVVSHQAGRLSLQESLGPSEWDDALVNAIAIQAGRHGVELRGKWPEVPSEPRPA